MSISNYFLKVKNLCSEISRLDPDELISKARMKRYIIRGLRKEYNPYIASLQGWANPPTLIEFENLLVNQEGLAKQMAECSISGNDEALFFGGKKKFQKKGNGGNTFAYRKPSEEEESSEKKNDGNRKDFKCYRCGKSGHIKKFCRVKLFFFEK